MGLLKRMVRSVRRAHDAHSAGPRTRYGRYATILICLLAGFMITVSALASREGDLRPDRSTDLVELVKRQSSTNQQLAAELSRLREETDELAGAAAPNTGTQETLMKAAGQASLTPVSGPAVSVTLTDAPLSMQPEGVAGDLLVVHQQDIQAVVNALWAGGAEAMTIQGVRVISTTGIKCVGNSVVLQGVPHAPPYVITAIGDQAKLEQALADSKAVQIYQQYVAAYQLGYSESRVSDVQMPAYEGSIELGYAEPVS